MTERKLLDLTSRLLAKRQESVDNDAASTLYEQILPNRRLKLFDNPAADTAALVDVAPNQDQLPDGEIQNICIPIPTEEIPELVRALSHAYERRVHHLVPNIEEYDNE